MSFGFQITTAKTADACNTDLKNTDPKRSFEPEKESLPGHLHKIAKNHKRNSALFRGLQPPNNAARNPQCHLWLKTNTAFGMTSRSKKADPISCFPYPES